MDFELNALDPERPRQGIFDQVLGADSHLASVSENDADIDAGLEKAVAFNAGGQDERGVLDEGGAEKLGFSAFEFECAQDALEFAVPEEAVPGDLKFSRFGFRGRGV